MSRENYKVNPQELTEQWPEEELQRVSQYLERLTQSKPEYGGAYVPGDCYTQGDIVTGDGALYLAKKDTCDDPNPIFTSEGRFVYQGGSPVAPVIAKTITFGTRYISPSDFSLDRYRVNIVAGNEYTVYSVNNPGPDQIINQIITFNANTTGWTEFSVAQTYVKAGTIFDLVVIVSEPATSPVVWFGDWNYSKPNNTTMPLVGGATQSAKEPDNLLVHKTDYTGGDRGAELLALVPGDRIKVGAMAWSISLVEDRGDYVAFIIAPASQADVTGVQVFNFETVSSTQIPCMKDIGWWDTHMPGDVFGLYIENGDYSNIVPDTNAYGVDIFLRAVERSDDWKLMLAGSSGSGAVNPVFTYDYVKVNGIIDIPDTYTPLATLVTPNRVQGIYELKLSMSWVFDRTTNSAFFRWRETDELGVFSPWNETVQEPKDKTDTNNTFYAYPTEWGGGVKRVEIEGRKETGAGTLDVSYLDIVFERKL